MRIAFALLSLISLSFAGCGGKPEGPKLETVTGKVTFDGQPLKEGDVTVTPLDPGGRSAGAKIVDGAFTLQTDVGKKKVEIMAMRDVPGKFREDNPGEKVQVREQFIPKQYNEKSDLTLDVKVGPNDPVFDLKK